MLLFTFFLTLSPIAVSALTVSPGSFSDGGNTAVSAMMMFVGNDKKVYILDKAEGNAVTINGHSAWGSVWDIDTHVSTAMDVRTNSFCASGMHVPNGSYVLFGGNGAVGPGGNKGSQAIDKFDSSWDSTYQDFDGRRAIRVLNPCTDADDFSSNQCQWYDEPETLAMQKNRWYSAAEADGDGNVVIIGGFTNGGYVNRNYPNIDPLGNLGAEYTYEYYPPRTDPPQIFQFLVRTSGLNAYAHTFLMPSGKMFVQTNLSTILWDHNLNVETELPDMPNGVVRVYPASGATAMLPLTPANNYTPTILFCGGSAMSEYDYGDYTYPYANTWDIPASQDCQRITPEPQDGSLPVYLQDDDMLEGRTMGQFIALPNGKLLVVNGGLNGTAGYAPSGTLLIPDVGQLPFGTSLAAGPVLTPAIYDPDAPKGSRWSNEGLAASTIPRLYHSSALLLPDASVLIAGSNPNVDVNLTTVYNTTYQAEIFYPPYFSAPVRPVPSGIPKSLSYGGAPFDITIPAGSYAGPSNTAAGNTTVVIIRSGFTTHAMNMGQRFMQLNNTFTVNSNGSITLHVAQLPPNPNLFQPGPAFLFVNVFGIPSNGTYVIVGNGIIGKQPTAPASVLPPSVLLDSASGTSGTGGSDSPSVNNQSKPELRRGIIGIIVGVVLAVVLLTAIAGVLFTRRRRTYSKRKAYAMGDIRNVGIGTGTNYAMHGFNDHDSDSLAPLEHSNHSNTWNASSVALNPYSDDSPGYNQEKLNLHTRAD